MSAPLIEKNDALLKRRSFMQTDDFDYYIDADRWTKLAADANATVTCGSSEDGLLVLFTGDLTDNNEAAIKSTNKLWTIKANQSLFGEGGINFTEGNTDDANIAFGFSSAIAANWLLDNGAGPAASQSAAMIFKVDGGTAWKTCAQVGTTSTIQTSTTTAGGNQTLTIEAQGQPDGSVDVVFKVNDQHLLDSTTNLPIKPKIVAADVANAAAMHFGAYVKAGGTTAAETLNVDYVSWSKTRARVAGT